MKKEQRPGEEIQRAEQEIRRMEDDLLEAYCEVGKAILETAERENQKTNGFVDEIIAARKRLKRRDCRDSGQPDMEKERKRI